MARITGHGDKKAMPHKELAKQVPDAFVIIDDQKMRRRFAHVSDSLMAW
jgi:diaminopimelate decarboxylase